jgi:hypothetical protein
MLTISLLGYLFRHITQKQPTVLSFQFPKHPQLTATSNPPGQLPVSVLRPLIPPTTHNPHHLALLQPPDSQAGEGIVDTMGAMAQHGSPEEADVILGDMPEETQFYGGSSVASFMKDVQNTIQRATSSNRYHHRGQAADPAANDAASHPTDTGRTVCTPATQLWESPAAKLDTSKTSTVYIHFFVGRLS